LRPLQRPDPAYAHEAKIHSVGRSLSFRRF
jgi:hypothetical protein